jgi:uncharacterized protein YjdB
LNPRISHIGGDAMRKTFFKKCLMALGLYLFFTIIFSFWIVDNTMVAQAASIEKEQDEIKLNVKSRTLVEDSSYALKIYNINDNYIVSYKTSESSIVSVDETGVMTAVDLGTSTITATIKDEFKTIATLECEVTVVPQAFSVKLTKSEVTLFVGEKTTLTAILKTAVLTSGDTIEQAKFSSNDPLIATVSIGGRITAKKVGVTYVFASIDNGKTDMCTVTVIEADENQEIPIETE